MELGCSLGVLGREEEQAPLQGTSVPWLARHHSPDGRGRLEGTVRLEHSCEPCGVTVLLGVELVEPAGLRGPSLELMPPVARGNHFKMKVMIQLVVIHQVRLSFLGLGRREAE
jgi:hypothetical protein